jgi:hypothetical protein
MTALLIAPTAGETLLSYALGVHPDPLQAGQRAGLVLVVSNAGDQAITCRGIVLTLPVGTAATDLIDGGSAVDTSPAQGWTVEALGGVITFTAPAGGAVIEGAGLIFTATITLNPQPGTATILLQETASDDDDPSQVRTASFTVDKFPVEFSLSDLTAVPADALDIAYGQPAYLNWIAKGKDVSCTLHYQPADEGAPVSQEVPNTPSVGRFTTHALTRRDRVVFTLIARMNISGQDNPVTAQRQLEVTVASLWLTFSVAPSTVPVNGLVRLEWHAPNATSCILDLDESQPLPSSGFLFRVMTASHEFSLAALGPEGQFEAAQCRVTVDPALVATETGYTIAGSPGRQGISGPMQMSGDPADGEPGGRGGDAILTGSLPPLDLAGTKRIVPISLRGGDGGAGGNGSVVFNGGGLGQMRGGNGGNGGNAIANVTLDALRVSPAQYIIVEVISGSAGAPGLGMPPGRYPPPGSAGHASLTIDGRPVSLP